MSHAHAILLRAHVQRKATVSWMDDIVGIQPLILLPTKLIY